VWSPVGIARQWDFDGISTYDAVGVKLIVVT
jgi:hypothetical protein